MKKVGIIGYGRFGELFARLGRQTFDIHIVETDTTKQGAAKEAGHSIIEFDELAGMDFIMLAVPISSIEAVVKQLAPLVHADQVVFDVCSVKVYPTKLMQTHLAKCQILATHPLFGPDSARTGLKDLPVALCPIKVDDENVRIIADFWKQHEVKVYMTTPEEHDKDSVYSQAFTYSVAKIILNMDLPDITFSTKSYNAITRIAMLSARDTEQLFHDMLYYNPYFSDMKKQLESAIKNTSSALDTIEAEQASNDWR